MKIAPARTDSFVKSPDAALRVALVYGPDAGLVRERGLLLARTACETADDPFRVATPAPGTVAEDPALLMDEMAAQSLSGGRRLVHIQGAGDGLALALTNLLANLPGTDTLLVIEAGDLGKNSKLRKLCEGGGSETAAIACYTEDGPARRRTIATLLREQGFEADGDALDLLAETAPADRMALKSELEKLSIYAMGRQKISRADVAEALGDGGAAELDALAMAVGAGAPGEVARLAQRLLSENMSFVMLLRTVQRHLLRLQLARAALDSGRTATDAIKSLRPPVFWKHETPMVRQLQRWSAERLARALVHLAEAEAQCKSTGIPAETVCAQALVTVAR
ncbi:MAG: DNA polymerase III subunit delta [Alphaproteobacteria bacterium]|nr:DNA polymerase III subunit delta [Alphaproteobacteria bacterium]